MQILDGKKLSQKFLFQLSEEIEKLKIQGKKLPRLDVIMVGSDFGSIKYVQMKEKVAKEVGVIAQVHYLPNDVNTLDVVNLIDSLNKNPEVTGIMVQLPLPSHINTNGVLESILPNKDVDGLTPTNLGRLFQDNPTAIPPATPVGIMKLLEEYNIKIFGKHVVILGSSNIVGTPLAAMMLRRHATVSVCNSDTTNIEEIIKQADILVSATGKPLLIKGEYLKKDVVVVDVGSNKDPETGKLVGDVDWNSVQGIPSFITPVPGGVGPMTIVSLILNLMSCYKNDKR
ncbi:MAG: bifunctional 5,10-methylenetetrahydrofolate dehydrogenase/5,10-methenyltetrahydrofolate cyclohydrolase [Candidatus Dojkabacteria bacterium]|jgi:methylenetetrahydrofolate dehydrogenase (NADP+)/methenyltetrahydrofolate cyclohydrolase